MFSLFFIIRYIYIYRCILYIYMDTFYFPEYRIYYNITSIDGMIYRGYLLTYINDIIIHC